MISALIAVCFETILLSGSPALAQVAIPRQASELEVEADRLLELGQEQGYERSEAAVQTLQQARMLYQELTHSRF
jgi:hypothetical protein